MSDSRIDELFQKVINGESIEDFQPISRSEAYLKAALTRSGVEGLPTPISRLDVLLYELASKVADTYQDGSADGFEKGKDAEWNKFWDVFQLNGARTGYAYAFYGSVWGKGIFKPKYDVKPVGSATSMFYSTLGGGESFNERLSMKELEQELGIVFDFSEVTNANSMFRHSFFKELNVIDFSKCTTIQFAFCAHHTGYTVERIERLIFGVPCSHGEGQPFSSCNKITHIGFEGTIDCNRLNFSNCTLLDKESLVALLNCLVDKSTDTSSTTWKITIGDTNLAKLTADEQNIAIQKGWNLS